MKQAVNKKIIVLIVAFAVVTGLVVVLKIGGVFDQSTSSETTLPAGQAVSIKGEIVCLPHKDTTGPQTEECALGLKAENGKHYSLLTDRVGNDFQTVNEKVTVHGLLNDPSATQIYDIIGAITVEKIEKQ